MTAVLLDVDTGLDDALALLLAANHPGIDLLGVSCTAGNVDVDTVVANTLAVLSVAGRDDVPVARGAERPLIEPHRDARHVHGANGMGDVVVPPAEREVDPRHAVEFLRDALLASDEPVTVIALAPLTNLAMLFATYPQVTAKVERLVFMGGTVVAPGNATAVAEFNTWHDPEAAAIVLRSGVPTTMYGLDVFYEPVVDRAGADRLLESDSPAAQLAGALLDRQLTHRDPEGTTIGDAGAVAIVVDPSLTSSMSCPVEVSLAPGETRGQTVADRRLRPAGEQIGSHVSEAAPVDVVMGIDAVRASALFVDQLLVPVGYRSSTP